MGHHVFVKFCHYIISIEFDPEQESRGPRPELLRQVGAVPAGRGRGEGAPGRGQARRGEAVSSIDIDG